MQSIIKAVALFSALAWASLPAAAETIQISLVEPILVVDSAQPFVDVQVALTNLDMTDTVFLNADNLNVSPDFQADDEFFSNAPISLNPGQSTGPISLFTLTLEPGTPSASYVGSYELFGGVGTDNQFNFDPLGSTSFTVEVPAPEPPTLLFTGVMLVGIASLGRRRRHKGRAH
jgi:hypothetical protein